MKIKIKEDALQSNLFKSLWEKISKKAKYIVKIDTDKFCDESVKEIQNVEIISPEISVQKVRLDKITKDEIKGEFVRVSSEESKVANIFNIVKFIEDETKLTRNTIFNILNRVNNFNLLFTNPHRYSEKAVEIIKWKLKEFEVENIGYFELSESFDVEIFNMGIQTYDKYVVKVNKSIYEGIIKDSDIEEKFAKALDSDSRIKLFIKLPEQYTIETPAGNYTPDWLILVEKIKNGVKKEKIYFVVETKGTNNLYDPSLRDEERIKIKSAEKRFYAVKEAGVKYIAPIKDYESFVAKW